MIMLSLDGIPRTIHSEINAPQALALRIISRLASVLSEYERGQASTSIETFNELK